MSSFVEELQTEIETKTAVNHAKHFKRKSSYANKECHENQDKKKKKAEEFRYGNYHQYYGYRNKGNTDTRLSCMKEEWFKSKDVLDIGCNCGHFTLTIAKEFEPRSIVGLDIDYELVKMAKRNTRYYVEDEMFSEIDFPLSVVLSFGPIAQSLHPKYSNSGEKFPFNVQFIQGNYILPSDEMLAWQEPCFDTVLCLSLTKWIHLNWGDDGVKRLFRRAFAHLRPGGFFILEAQAYRTYAKKKKITEEMAKNYKEIQFYPEMFNEYLIKEVGFKSCELIDTPAHPVKGFSRPIYLFIKGGEENEVKKPKHIIYDSDSSCDYSDVEQLSD